MNAGIILPRLEQIRSARLQLRPQGSVIAVHGGLLLARIPGIALGDMCSIETRNGGRLNGQVVAFNERVVSIAPYDSALGIGLGANVEGLGALPSITLPQELLGSVIDSLGKQIDVAPPPEQKVMKLALLASPPAPLTRRPISTRLATGVRAIDACSPIGYGQRIALMAEAGAGKSTLMGMIVRQAQVDVAVIALVGERGREVSEFVHDNLGPEGRRRSVVVVATSDQSSLRRLLAAQTATSIAEYYRNQGKRVLLLVDSLTRTARALREIGLASGELPVRQGYTPSVFSELPRLLERAGNDANGSITAIYTLLLNAENEVDPLADEIKSLLDGHIILSNSIAQRGLRPAIDITKSLSRLGASLMNAHERDLAQKFIRLSARLTRDRDIVLLGGTPDDELKRLLARELEMQQVLHQTPDELVRDDVYARLEHFLSSLTDQCYRAL